MSDNDEQLNVLITEMREQTLPSTKGWYRLDHLLIKLDYLNKAEQVYRIFLDQILEIQKKDDIYHRLGCIINDQGIHEETLELFRTNLSVNYGNWDCSYNNIVFIYEDTGEYTVERLVFENSLEIRQQYSIRSIIH